MALFPARKKCCDETKEGNEGKNGMLSTYNININQTES